MGRQLAKRADSKMVDRLYLFALALIALICCYNFCRFTGMI